MASISSVPSTPSWTSHETALSRPRRSAAILPETPDLQTCLGLLTKQLSSAVNSSHTQPNADTTALQVWAMIEAYEKLRDQVTTTREGEVQDSPLGPVFDMWLKALHSVHEGMHWTSYLSFIIDKGRLVLDGFIGVREWLFAVPGSPLKDTALAGNAGGSHSGPPHEARGVTASLLRYMRMRRGF
ncbi:hypothetical protein NUW58_g10131 [Xylaria curta]|uniref:Uncharacterized protein n=1 Tax=Xylaria curta TaxID=42375 RepID=A0ACC1MQF1_9PEZI|nr:hypothetical protein NUW58_g10131 [Xylaria curta]